MSFVTFVRDYIQDPDRIIHIPNFVFDACKEFFGYIFSFQWFRNLTYITLYKPSPEQNSTLLIPSLYGPSKTLTSTLGRAELVANGSIQNHVSENAANYLNQNNNQIENFLNDGSWLSTYLPDEQLSFFHNSLYGFFNGFSSTFHFCAVTILIIHVLLNEDFNRALKIALASCFGDFSCIVAVLFGKRELIIPWLALEPLGYILGFGIQFFFALEIIKDNRRIKANFDKVRQFNESSVNRRSSSTDARRSVASRSSVNIPQLGKLSYNRWIIPLLILFSWCEQTQFFQTTAIFGLQPTATLLEIPGLTEPLQISIYLLSFIATRILVTCFCLLIFQNLVNVSVKIASLVKNKSLSNLVNKSPRSYNLLIPSNRQEAIVYIRNNFSKIYNDLIGLVYYVKSWFIPKSLQNAVSTTTNYSTEGRTGEARPKVESTLQNNEIYIKGRYTQVQQFLSDPLAIAAVTCSLAFLPAYSTNLLVTKSIGFFPDENRVKHSLFSPWDMPATILASDMDFISNHPNSGEYPFFLPFYDKGEYGGWLTVGEEDIRYGPFRLWQSRRIRAPWRRTTLQEPALTFANDKSLFINPLHRTPDLKENDVATSKDRRLLLGEGEADGTSLDGKRRQFAGARPVEGSSESKTEVSKRNQPNEARRFTGVEKLDLQSTANIQSGTFIGPTTSDPPNSYFTQKWKYLWGQFKNQSAYTKLLAINYAKLLREGEADGTFPGEAKPIKGRRQLLSSHAPIDYSYNNAILSRDGQQEFSAPLNQSVLYNDPIKEFHKAERSNVAKTSLDVSSTTRLPSVNVEARPMAERRRVASPQVDKQNESLVKEQTIIKAENSKITKAGKKKLVAVLKRPLKRIKASSFLHESKTSRFNPKFDFNFGLRNVGEAYLGPWVKMPYLRPKADLSLQKPIETKIKNNKQTRKRSKKFRKSSRLFRTRAYKKRSTKIRRLKHFQHIKDKNKRRRKSGRLIYKLRRHYPYIRNIKERKADSFGFNSYVPTNIIGQPQEISSEGEISKKISFKEKPLYPTEYPKKKDFINIKKDFNLLFRTQIGERLDFAQEEIRARIFMNPYVHYLLNNRIDNFVSRSPKVAKPAFYQLQPKIDNNISGKNKENNLFKRRLLISKYADAVNFLKPNSRHSYIDRVYNHQFKGTLSTARRLFSLKVQYDRPLVYPLNYKSAIEHEGLSSINEKVLPKIDNASIYGQTVNESMNLSSPKGVESQNSNLLQKSCSAPLYASWDPDLRKLILTNRYLDYKTITTVGMLASDAPVPSSYARLRAKLVNVEDRPEVSKNQSNKEYDSITEGNVERLISYKDRNSKNNKARPTFGQVISFTNWPLKEPYFRDNEFLVSQLYSNSQPIDSLLSQENEKARPATLSRRVSSFNTVLYSKNNVQPTDAQRSQQFLKLESNDKKTFLFKHLWNSSNTANGLISTATEIEGKNVASSGGFTYQLNSYPLSSKIAQNSNGTSLVPPSMDPLSKNQKTYKPSSSVVVPISSEQRKANRMEEREYPLWMVFKLLPPNQGGFLWPGN